MRIPADAVDDLAQATAEVVLRKRPPFVAADDLAPYVRIVARHKALRWIRSTARETVGLPELAAAQSVAEVARLKLLAAGTLQAYERLEPVQRERLSRYLAGERAGNSAERARERKRIERIRLHMAQAIERIAAATVGWRKFIGVAGRPEFAAAAAIALVQAIAGVLTPPASATTETIAAGPPPVAAPAAPALDVSTVPAPEPTPSRPTVASRPTQPSREQEDLASPPNSPVVVMTSPTGKTTVVSTGPNPPEKPLVCVRSAVEVCVDKPFTL